MRYSMLVESNKRFISAALYFTAANLSEVLQLVKIIRRNNKLKKENLFVRIMRLTNTGFKLIITNIYLMNIINAGVSASLNLEPVSDTT